MRKGAILIWEVATPYFTERVVADSAEAAIRLCSKRSENLSSPVRSVSLVMELNDASLLMLDDAQVRAAVETIVEERLRQLGPENWDRGHDDEHEDADIPKMAAFYLGLGAWPFNEKTPNIEGKSYRRRVVIAAALLVAELERVDRRDAAARLK